jgi:hypothetical protein
MKLILSHVRECIVTQSIFGGRDLVIVLLNQF